MLYSHTFQIEKYWSYIPKDDEPCIARSYWEEYASQYANDLEQILDTLDRYKLKLNLDKCVFGVKAGKFMGFMISHRDIKVHPEKMEAILNMKAPKTLNELQKLNGRITALGRFI